jgi:dTDP-4-dehydrorhamnose reductase
VKILLTGGSGLLGTELCQLAADLDAPSPEVLDVRNAELVAEYIDRTAPELVIHAAAITDNRAIEADPREALEVNIKGSTNVALACLKRRTRLVYLSTDYVYPGDQGPYEESAALHPFNLYAWTKLAGEAAVRAVPNHLIIRLSFGPKVLSYSHAFTDKWSSKEYVDLLAPQLLEAAMSPLTGVLNLGGERRSLFDFARLRNPEVQPLRREQAVHDSPSDTSLELERWRRYREGEGPLHPHARCRICDSAKLVKYLDLGMMPLANNLERSAIEAKRMQRFPLQVMVCEDCGLSQLSVVIDPELLFSHYTYRSSVNKGYLKHCRQMAKELGARLALQSKVSEGHASSRHSEGIAAVERSVPESERMRSEETPALVVDIAGNDGALLGEFREELGVRVLNVDPAQNLAEIAESKGIPTMPSFWSVELAKELVEKHGQPKLITATNVFAHVDDVRGFLRAVKLALRPDGALVLEFPYLLEFLDGREFDTVYFEHLSYVGCLPLMRLCADEGLCIFDLQPQDIHGGTLRVFIASPGAFPEAPAVSAFLERERARGLDQSQTYLSWAAQVDALVEELRAELGALRKQGAKIAAFGASAKGNTLLNVCGFGTETIAYIVDDTPEKIGKFSPGTGIPIVSRSELESAPPDYLLILAWNFAKEIMRSAPSFQGKWLIPVPSFQVLSNTAEHD